MSIGRTFVRQQNVRQPRVFHDDDPLARRSAFKLGRLASLEEVFRRLLTITGNDARGGQGRGGEGAVGSVGRGGRSDGTGGGVRKSRRRCGRDTVGKRSRGRGFDCCVKVDENELKIE